MLGLLNKRNLLMFLMILNISFFMLACSFRTKSEHRKDFFALDTVVTLRAYGEKLTEEALNKAADRIEEIEDRMSHTRKNSDVYMVNQAAGVKPIKVHEDTFYVIKKALDYGELSKGAFDITIYPIVKLWDIRSEPSKLPNPDEIRKKLTLVNYKDVVLDENNKTVFLRKKGMGIDLGAIAKGYAADEAARILREAQVEHALLNLGGNIITIGEKPDGDHWRIGLQNPRPEETKGDYFSVIEVKDATVVVSGDYERYIKDIYEKTGKRYHHIFDTKTGYPAEKGIMATTIISNSSLEADALSTIVFVMGREKGFNLINDLEGVQAMIVTLNKEIFITGGLKDKIISFNDEYKIMD